MNFRNALAASALLMISVVPCRAAPQPDLAQPDQLRPGQKAVVKTVFQGGKVEEFEAEIVGVLAGGRAEGDLILARATTDRVVRSGIAAGMSGSPVYVEGKLIGALSSGWSFSKEPVFGITPIGEMLSVLDLPEKHGDDGTAGPAGAALSGDGEDEGFAGLTWREPGSETKTGPAAATPSSNAARPLPIPVACGGLHAGAFDQARSLLEPLGLTAVPGGGSASSAPAAPLEPGSAVAVDLMRGDLNLSAIGTVTWRDGDRVLIFGHPLFQSGEVRLPLSTAEITTVMPSAMMSFKLGRTGTPVGTVLQDRRTAVMGHMGPAPRLMPLSIRVEGVKDKPQQFRFESAQDRTMVAQMVSLAAFNSWLESGGTAGNQTLRWTMRLRDRSGSLLTLSDVLAGESPPGELVAAISAPLRFLYSNPYRRVDLDSMSLVVERRAGRSQWTLRSAELLDPAVRPGGRVRVRCELERWRGPRETHVLELQVPLEAPDGRYTLWVGGGAEFVRYEAPRRPGRYRPTSYEDAWARLQTVRPSDALYAALWARAPEVTRSGRDYPELPSSALAVMSGRQTAGELAQRGDRALLDEQRLPLVGPVRGDLLLEAVVDTKAP